MGCMPSSEKIRHCSHTEHNAKSHNSDATWLNRPEEGYHWENNKAQNTNFKKDTRTASASQQDGTGVEGLVAVEAYGAADGMGAAACGAGGCGGCGGCGA